ncbi:MAG TPA: Tad domain-containing protein [Polyangiaceae bacterium]
MSPGTFKSDERGAIMLIALFMAIFGVAILFYGVATTESVLFREHLQDTADSAALSTAITYARLMNAIVLINIVMAALVAILLTLKLVEAIAIAGIAICVALAFFTGGASLAPVAPLNALRSTMKGLYDSLKPTVFNVLEVLHDVSGAVVKVPQVAAQAVALSEIKHSRDNVASEGFAYSASLELPLEPDSYSKLCKHAGELVRLIARKPFEKIGVAGAIDAALSPIPVLAEAMSDWFCGDGGTTMPDLSQEVERAYPRSDSVRDCENETFTDVERGKETEVKSRVCEQADSERLAAQPDAMGECQTQCDMNGPFEVAVKQARVECDPSGNPKPSLYRYQQQHVTVVYHWNGKEWEKGPPVIESSVRTETQPPCGPANVHPTVAEGYNQVVHPEGDATSVNLVCSAEGTPELPYPDPEWTEKQKAEFAPDPVTYEYDQVRQIFSCKHKERSMEKSKEKSDTRAHDGGNAKSPRKLKNDIELGSETFQVRSAVFGELGGRQSARLVRLGLWGRSDPDNPSGRLKEFGGFSVAQAEYYYAGSGSPEDWMWNMSWRARLRRFDTSSVPNKSKKKGNDAADPMESLEERCALPENGINPANCAKLLGAVEATQDIIAH